MSAPSTVGESSTNRRTGSAPAVPGEPGIWVVIFGDLLVFSTLFVAFLIDRSQEADAFHAARRTLHSAMGFANTLVLLSSSLLVVVGLRALRAGRRNVATNAVVAAMILGGAFIVVKVGEYVLAVSAGHTPGSGNFYAWYFLLTGMHLAHVMVGMVVLGVIARLSRRSTPDGTTNAVIGSGACFWHLVDLLWIFLFPLLYLV